MVVRSLIGIAIVMLASGVASAQQVASTPADFFMPGSQPGGLDQSLTSALSCSNCHTTIDESHGPQARWSASMMAQATRDPIFQACLDIANQDAAFAGEYCLRCHTPMGWMGGRSLPPDGSALAGADFQGVSCIVCHRMVDPDHGATGGPPEDAGIRDSLIASGLLPAEPHTGNYVLDPMDRRRGPYDLDADWIAAGHPGGFIEFHQWRESPFHQTSELCATCHDINNPMYELQGDGSYALTELDAPHPTQDKATQFPVERTYSEWAESAFAQGPIDMGGRFGGNNPLVSSCQDCHMQDTSGFGCEIGGPPLRHDLPQHNFNGANSWVLAAVRASYFDSETGLTEQSVADSIQRNKDMLARASDLELLVDGSMLRTRVINQGGHKLPTGYTEGRRMWVNVVFVDAEGVVLHEHGAYDKQTAELHEADTKVYQGEHGLDETVAALTGNSSGPGFHFALNNKIFFDNRIPPRGFTNAGFESVQAEPVAYVYEDGQYWDDTLYEIPAGATFATVRVYHQTTSKEYIEFLRDENDASLGDPENPSSGEIAYNLWEQLGKSAPVEMDLQMVNIACPCDANLDNEVGIADLLEFLDRWLLGDSSANFNGDGEVDILDLLVWLDCYFECR